MHARKRSLATLVGCGLVVLLGGCFGSDDDPADPAGGNPLAGDPALQAQIDLGIEAANELLDMIPGWAAGDFVVLPDKDAIYNPGCTCWQWTEESGNAYSNPFDYKMWQFNATFYAGETAQQTPEGADRLEVTLNYIHSFGTVPTEQNTDNESTTFAVYMTVIVSPVGGNPVSVYGGGAGYASYDASHGEGYTYAETDFGVDLDMTLPLPGCPTGIMTFDTEDEENGPTLVSVSYDGDSTISWTVSQGWEGETQLHGSETVPCGNK